TREWVRKADMDWVMARQSGRSAALLHDGVCFHCQQRAEKYLKALLEELGLTIPRTHNLDDLLSQVSPHHSMLRGLPQGLIFLTDFAVDTRYPGRNASKRQASAALRWADQVRTAARRLLSIRGAGPRRRRSR